MLSHKNNTFPIFTSFIKHIETQFQTHIKLIKSDNNLKLYNTITQTFYSNKKIIHQTSYVNTPQQNNIIIKKHKSLLKITKSLFFQTHLPIQYWKKYLLTATYLINRLPSSVLNHKSPYKLLYNHLPLYKYLKNVNYLYFITIPKKHRTKFHPRTSPYIFLNYPYN